MMLAVETVICGDDLVLSEDDLPSSSTSYQSRTALSPPPSAAALNWPERSVAHSWLETKVGPEPSHTWVDEWPRMHLEEYRLQGVRRSLSWVRKHDRLEGAIARMRDRIDWKLAAGWEQADAEAVTCISSSGLSAVARAIHDRSPEFAASTHVLHRALVASACMNSGISQPEVYRNLTGTFGLATVDPSWSILLSAPKVGTSFVTCGITIASDSSDCFRTDGRGFCVPIRVDGKAQNVLQDSDIVCLRSAPTDDRGFHGVVQTSGSLYQLPPGTAVMVMSIDAPGEWSAYGVAVRRHLFTISVCFG